MDADELRRRIDGAIEGKTGGTPWGDGRRYGLRIARGHLDAMPTTTAPKGWTRDEVLAELAKHPDNVCEALNPIHNEWEALTSFWIEQWHPEVRRFDVRVVRSTPDPEWVPLTKLVGRTIHGCDVPVERQPLYCVTPERWEWTDGCRWLPFPDGTLNLDDATVAVRPEAAT